MHIGTNRGNLMQISNIFILCNTFNSSRIQNIIMIGNKEIQNMIGNTEGIVINLLHLNNAYKHVR
jgi:hypothetical protein